MLRRIPALGSSLAPRPTVAECVAFLTSLRGVRNTRNDSCNDSLTSSHFDMQDIPVERLTHSYWDDVNSPYDDMFLLDEHLHDEGGVDTTEHILQRDRQMLRKEYL